MSTTTIRITASDVYRRARNGRRVGQGATLEVDDGVAEALVARGDAEIVEDEDGGEAEDAG